MKKTSTRQFIAGLEHDAIACVVNAYLDAHEFVRGQGSSLTAANAAADDAFIQALSSIAPRAKYHLRNERTGVVESEHESFDEALAWAERHHKQTGANYLLQEAE